MLRRPAAILGAIASIATAHAPARAQDDAVAGFYKGKTVTVIVGYTAAYALWVHESVEMKWEGEERRSGIGEYWGPHGQAKFLEAPARYLAAELGRIARTAIAKGATLAQALVLAGLRLQRESQMLVPVEYGNLKNSAFTRLETEGGGEASSAAVK